MKRTFTFHIQRLDEIDQHPFFAEDIPLRLSHYEFFWVKTGGGCMRIDFQEIPLEENCIYCLAPGQLRHLKTCGVLGGYYLALSAELFYQVEGKVDYTFFAGRYDIDRNTGYIKPTGELLHELNEIVKLMIKEYDRNSFLRAEILGGFLKLFMLYLSLGLAGHDRDFKFDKEEDLVMKFMTLVKNNFTKMKMVADYAAELEITPSYLNQIVKRVSGFTASYCIQQCIILEAKRRALPTGARLKEVAYFLGFDDCAHFSKFFKHNSGMSFTSFKKWLAANGNSLQSVTENSQL